MINWFKNIFASKPDTETGAVEGGLHAIANYITFVKGASPEAPLYYRVIDATNLTKPQYAVNFSLTQEERSARSRKAAATRKAKRETMARLNHENLRRALQASVDAA